jgi:hypothetical protein
VQGKGKDKHTMFKNPYTQNVNKHDMLKIHAGVGKHTDSLNRYVLESLVAGKTKADLLEGLKAFINPDATVDKKPSILLSKTRYRLHMAGIVSVYDAGSDTYTVKGVDASKGLPMYSRNAERDDI